MKYELELKHRHGSEIRLTERPLNVGDEFESDGTRWRVAEVGLPHKDLVAIVRYVCIDLREESRLLRAESNRLVEIGRRLRRKRFE